VVRYWQYEHRWFILSGAALLQVILHGFIGMSYLRAGVISLTAAIFLMGMLRLLRPNAQGDAAT
jgi:hypothetical protein